MKTRRTLIMTGLAFLLCLQAGQGLKPGPAWGWGRGHFYVIGTGPAGPRTATLQALDTIKQMDVILAPPAQAKLFADYIQDTPVLMDPWTGIWDYKGKMQWELPREDLAVFKKERFRLREERIAQFKDLLAKGQDVGLLDYGNPCLYGPSHWYTEALDPDDVIIIPGMGCDAAAMAALGKSTIPAHDVRFVVQSSPFSLMRWGMRDRALLKELSEHPMTLVLYMALWEPQKLFAALSEVFPPDTPCAVVYWAGYPERERVLAGTVADMGDKLAQDKERFMGLLFVGRFLEGKPYESAMYQSQAELQGK